MNLRLHIFVSQFLWLVAVLNAKSFQGIPGYGRNLLIKTIPAVEDYQSNVYEVFMEPYLYELGSNYPLDGDRSQKQIQIPVGPRPAPGLQAIVHLQDDEESGVGGELVFTQFVSNGPVSIEGNITGLAPGLHGLHVHQSGDIDEDCKKIGPHFIAYYGRHGGPRDHVRHVGDLGNIKAEEGATLNVRIVDHLISLTGPRSIVGRSIAITKSEDDYGRASTEDSALTGTSGPAIACGIIGYALWTARDRLRIQLRRPDVHNTKRVPRNEAHPPSFAGLTLPTIQTCHEEAEASYRSGSQAEQKVQYHSVGSDSSEPTPSHLT